MSENQPVNDDDAFRLFQAGRDELDAGLYDQSIKTLEQSVALHPHHKTYGLLAEAYEAVNNSPQAIRCYCSAVLLGRDVRAAKRLELLLNNRDVVDFHKTLDQLWCMRERLY